MPDSPLTPEGRLASLLSESPTLRTIFQRWNEIALPDAWLGAGCVAQTGWNVLFGDLPERHIKDIDLVYFEAADLSVDSEVAHWRRLRDTFANLPVPLDVKNQARVHLWYEKGFGRAIPPFKSVADAVRGWPTTSSCVAVRPRAVAGSGSLSVNGNLEVCSPFGLADLLGGVVRPNKALVSEAAYRGKVARWASCWPMLRVEPW